MVCGLFLFFVKFYTDHIKFHILIVSCEFCYILQKMPRKRVNCVGCFLGGNFVSSLIWTRDQQQRFTITRKQQLIVIGMS